MFGPRYFGARYFGPRYWGVGGLVTSEAELLFDILVLPKLDGVISIVPKLSETLALLPKIDTIITFPGS